MDLGFNLRQAQFELDNYLDTMDLAGPDSLGKREFRAYQNRVEQLKKNVRTARNAMNKMLDRNERDLQGR